MDKILFLYCFYILIYLFVFFFCFFFVFFFVFFCFFFFRGGGGVLCVDYGGLSEYGVLDSFTDYPYGIYIYLYILFLYFVVAIRL